MQHFNQKLSFTIWYYSAYYYGIVNYLQNIMIVISIFAIQLVIITDKNFTICSNKKLIPTNSYVIYFKN